MLCYLLRYLCLEQELTNKDELYSTFTKVDRLVSMCYWLKTVQPRPLAFAGDGGGGARMSSSNKRDQPALITLLNSISFSLGHWNSRPTKFVYF